MNITLLLEHYGYIFLFVGVLAAGEAVLIPAIYLSLAGYLNPLLVFWVSSSGTFIADIIWYLIGRRFSFQRIKHLPPVARREGFFTKLSALFDRSGPRILFLSKFVYGSRTIVQIISGMKHMKFTIYSAINGVGILSYAFLLFLIGYGINEGVEASQSLVAKGKIIFLVFVIVVIILNLIAKKIIGKKMLESDPNS